MNAASSATPPNGLAEAGRASISAPPRSWLYVPATRPELVAKALAGAADAVVIDLEDAVPPAAKDDARSHLAELARLPRTKPLWVRANHPATEWGGKDVEVLADLPVDGVRLPKSEDPDLVAQVAERLALPVDLLLESALGVENVSVLARCSTWIRGIALGEADLLADLVGLDASALVYSRGRIVVAARAAGLPSPVMSVWTAIGDADGLRVDTLAARAAGFFGRSIIHPKQAPIVHDAFTPTLDEIADAERVVAAMREAADAGVGVHVDADGHFLDPAVLARARLVLDLAVRGDHAGSDQEDSP